MDKSALFSEIRTGNIEAFEILFREYYPSMCVIAEKYTHDSQAAEDIAQEVFIKLWEKRENYIHIPDLKVFLYVAVKNLGLNYIRDQKRKINYSETEIFSQDNFFRDQLIREETFRMISQAVDNLPFQSARIIKLVLEGKQNQEIAQLLGISVTTVKTLKYNALRTLKERLKQYAYLLMILMGNKF